VSVVVTPSWARRQPSQVSHSRQGAPGSWRENSWICGWTRSEQTPGQHGGRQPRRLDRQGRVGQLDRLDHELEALGQGDALPGREADLGDALAADREAPPQRQQPQVAAAQAEHRVPLRDPRIVDLQRGAPEPADEVAGRERPAGPVRQAKGRIRMIHAGHPNIGASAPSPRISAQWRAL
jgi:hypothetical protein